MDLSRNERWLSMLDTLVGASADLGPARAAFEATAGDFDARFAAAVQALVARQVSPEVFIDIPAEPGRLSRAELDALVRPVAAGRLRSQPTKGELLEQVELIRQRQARRPAWLPRADHNGRPLRPAQVSVEPAADGDDRAELVPAPGGLGELAVVLHTVLGLGHGPAGVLSIEASATVGGRTSLAAAPDPGVAAELLATTATLGGVPVKDGDLTALPDAAEWRYGPRWLVDRAPMLATARAALTAWADGTASGLLMLVYGGVLRGDEGLAGVPGPLHGFALRVTRAGDGTDTIDALHRVVLSCPGEPWCHRACAVEAGVDLTPVIAAADAAELASRQGSWASEAFDYLYDDGAAQVLDRAQGLLAAAGWVEVERSTWAGGLEDLLVRRGEHVLRASYDPLTRQLKLTDGRTLFEFLVQDGAMAQQSCVELALAVNQITVLGAGSPGLVDRQLIHLLRVAGVA